MRVFVLHNDYLQPSGESRSVEAEVHHLRDFGHEVELLMRRTSSEAGPLELARHLTYAASVRVSIERAIRAAQPDIIHAHNLFPWLSSAAIAAIAASGVPYVQTLRNYRTSCLSGNHYRENASCSLCTRAATAWRGVRHRCYRDSSVSSAGVMFHDATQRVLRYANRAARPARFIVLSNSMKRNIAPTLPGWASICVKYNSLLTEPPLGRGGRGIIFVGRLAAEKGIGILLEAWRVLPRRPTLTVIGEGPLAPQVLRLQAAVDELVYLPRVEHDHVMRLIGDADLLAAPALWEEPFGRTVMEALACGTPVLATAVGAAPEIIGSAGWVAPRTSEGLSALLPTALQEAGYLRQAARQRYETLLAPEATTRRLTEIYAGVLGRFRS